MDRTTARAHITKRLRSKLKKEVFDKNIEGLIDEYLETEKFIMENGVDVDSLPNNNEMKYWFQDKLPQEVLKNILDKKEKMYEISIDDIYIRINSDNSSKKDKFAEAIYKRLYKFEWTPGAKIPKELKELIKMHKVSQSLSNLEHKKLVDTRLANYAFVGVIRFYKLERNPYFKSQDIEKIISQFRLLLDVIYKIESGFYGDDNTIKGSVFLFDVFGKYAEKADPPLEEVKTKRKYKKRKQKDIPDGPQQL